MYMKHWSHYGMWEKLLKIHREVSGYGHDQEKNASLNNKWYIKWID